jgi:glycine cleavage system H protein
MQYPADLKYAKTHEWVRVKGDKAVVGITDFAQHELSDVVYVELPAVGDDVTAGGQCAVIESVKSASDIYSPVSGRITRVNEGVNDEPDIVNKDPYGSGWIFEVEMSDADELKNLVDANAYKKQVESK